MKRILFLLLFPCFIFAQNKGEVLSDTIYFGTIVNECGDTVYALTQTIELRGGRKFTNSEPVGFDENNPCSGVKLRDTASLVNFYANQMNDFGRQQAQKSKDFIFQTRSIRSFGVINTALINFRYPGIYATVEKLFADSLIGSYTLVRPGVANLPVTVVKTALGAVRIRLSGSSFLPVLVYSDGFITVRNIAGAGNDVDLYQIEPGRWISLLGNYQLVKKATQIVKPSAK
jgi:hypothetical protein